MLQGSDHSRDLAEIKLTEVFREHTQSVFWEYIGFQCFLLENCVLSQFFLQGGLYRIFVYLLFFMFVEFITFKNKTNAEVIDSPIF